MATQVAVSPVGTIRELPVIGSLWAFQKNRLRMFKLMAQAGDGVSTAHFGPFAFYLFNSSELVHALLVTQVDDFDKGLVFHNALRPVIGQGLLNSEGLFWRGQRKQIAPAFQPRSITSYADTMVRYTDRAQQGWREGQVIDISHEMMALTMSIVGKVLFDTDVLSESDELGGAVTTAIHWVDYASMHLFPMPLEWPLPSHIRTQRALALIHRRVQAMIDERRQHLEDRVDLLSMLLNARDADGQPMSDEQVRDEAVTLFLAGHETTATALSWAFYMLGRRPDIYARARAEVDAVLGERPATVVDLPRLPYCMQVIKETMRLYPPAYVLTRAALRDVEIGGVRVRKGQTVLLSPYTMHRRPDYFPEPQRFDPERFTPENEKKLPRHAYMPFGAGPRICVGNHFALMEAHLLLATLVQRVTFELVPGQRIRPNPKVTLRQKTGCRLIVHRRAAPQP
jgi:cytochrome P450